MNDLDRIAGTGVDVDVDVDGVKPTPTTEVPPPVNSEMYTLYHLLAMRLLDDDAGWMTKGNVGFGAGTKGVVVPDDPDMVDQNAHLAWDTGMCYSPCYAFLYSQHIHPASPPLLLLNLRLPLP